MLDLLREIGKLGCKPIDTPIEFNQGLCDAPDNPMVDRGSYKRLVGRLIYLRHTRPDITFIVDVVSIFMHSPKETCLRVVHRISQYSKGSSGKGVLFKREKA